MTDSGLAASLAGLDANTLARTTAMGPYLETFVVGELQKQLGWAGVGATISHFRDRDGPEVDIVLESRSGDVIGIEVKASANAGLDDTRGLRRLADHVGPDHFRHGVVLYTGSLYYRLGDDRFTACPVSSLWRI